MNRWLWIQLGSLVALLALAAFFLLAPAPARPVKPTELEPETARVRPSRVADEPVRLAEPPPAPDVANDPARGTVFLRVIDAETFLPLAGRRCELCEVETKLGDKPVSEFFWREIEPSTGEPRDFDTTDEYGLLAFKAMPADSKVFFNRVKFAPKLEWKYPLPPGFEPVSHPDTKAAALAALKDQPAARPVDMLVRPAPRVHGRVWDLEGRPAVGAEVFAWPMEVAPELDAWARCQSEHYNELGGRSKPNGPDIADIAGASLELMHNEGLRPLQLLGAIPGDIRMAVSSIAGSFRATTDRNGRYTLPTMFRGRWMICAWSKDTPYTARDCRLFAADHEIDFSMPTPPAPSLRVVIEFKGEVPKSTDFLVNVESCSPCGTATRTDSSRQTLSVDPRTPTAVFTGLAPGYYTVEVMASINMGKGGGWDNGALVRVEAGALATVVLPLGPAHEATWLPAVTVDGKSLSVASLLLQGGPHGRPELVGFTAKGRQFEGRRLPAGTYTARMPGIEPQTFTLAAGKSLTTNWHLNSSGTRFLIEPEFAASALKGAKQAKLQLYPLGNLREVAEHMLAHVNGVGDLEHLTLKANEPRTLVLFPGEYQWILDAEDCAFEGVFTIPSEGNSEIRFGLAGLPGLCRIDIDIEAYLKTVMPIPEIDITTERQGSEKLFAPPLNYSKEETIDFSPNYFGPIEERKGHFVVFVWPGMYRVGVGTQTMLTAAPGQLVFSPEEEAGLVKLSWTAARGDEATYRVNVKSENGLSQFPRAGKELRVKPGRFHIFATGHLFDNGDGASKQFCATRNVTVAADTVLDLDTWAWTRYGSFTLTCEGRGSPGEPFDAWWWKSDSWKGLKIVCTTRTDTLGPTEVVFADVDDWMPEGRMAFTFKDRSVPPGRYKVVPWPNAAEKYCRTFEVQSGQHTEVAVKGG